MNCLSLHRSRPDKNTYVKLPVSAEKNLRRICRPLAGSGDHSVGQTKEPGHSNQGDGSSSQKKPASAACCSCCGCCRSKTSADESNQKAAAKKEFTLVSELEAILPRFGPAYGDDMGSVKAFKDEALSRMGFPLDDQESSEISGDYFSAIRRVEKVARQTYAPGVVDHLKNPQFREMMIRDGCFFLQSALHILGGANLLGYPEKHVCFGSEIDDKEINRRLNAMFFIGNQIPSVVIRELMKQSFFQDVIRKGTWHPPSDSLPKMVLYLFVVLPELEKNQKHPSSWLFSKVRGQKGVPRFREPPSDLLHGLHCLVIGPGENLAVRTVGLDINRYTHDPEAGTDDDINEVFPSASALQNSGIRLRKAKRGIRGIHFNDKWVFFAYLRVPPFTFDGDTELMLQHLKKYEIEQLEKGKREVAAYLRFMSNLIQKPEDVKILKSKGIIQVKDNVQEDELPEMLRRFGSPQEITFTENLRLTRLQVINYQRPRWDLVVLTLFLTIVQTVFTVLSYAKPPKSS